MCVNSRRWAEKPSEAKVADFQHTFAVDQQIIRLHILRSSETTDIMSSDENKPYDMFRRITNTNDPKHRNNDMQKTF